MTIAQYMNKRRTTAISSTRSWLRMQSVRYSGNLNSFKTQCSLTISSLRLTTYSPLTMALTMNSALCLSRIRRPTQVSSMGFNRGFQMRTLLPISQQWLCICFLILGESISQETSSRFRSRFLQPFDLLSKIILLFLSISY